MKQAEIDAQLIEAVKAGDYDALASLYDRHAPKLMRIAYNILKNRQDAEDLLHDVFLEVWDKADSYIAARGSVLSWLMIRARSRAIDRKRSLNLRQDRYKSDSDLDEQIAVAPLDQSMNNHAIQKAMAQLPNLQRAAVQLSYFQGLTYQEIAHHDGVPLGTVKSRLSAAIQKLSLYFAATEEVGP